MNVTPNEVWLPVPGYEGSYEVSDQGRVRSVDRVVKGAGGHPRRLKGRVLKSHVNGATGAHAITLSADGRLKVQNICRLVLQAFVGPRPEGMECCHWNDDAADNRLANLRWDTRSANFLDQVRNGRHHYATRQQCPKGHDYTAENIYLTSKGSRACVICKNAYNKAYYQARKSMKKVSA